jgi:hypothetical protein
MNCASPLPALASCHYCIVYSSEGPFLQQLEREVPLAPCQAYRGLSAIIVPKSYPW